MKKKLLRIKVALGSADTLPPLPLTTQMNIELSWDLFVMVFFGVIMAYSFIIGRDNTLKIILGTYVAALAADAMGNLISKSLAGSEAFTRLLSFASVGNEQEAVVFVKVMVFVTLVVLFAVKGAFEVQTSPDDSAPVRLVVCGIYAALSAGLIISIILVFISGISFIDGSGAEAIDSALWDLNNKSKFIRAIVSNSYLWFSIPAFAFLIHSLLTKDPEDE